MLLMPDRESVTDQKTDAIKVQLSEPASFIGAIYRNMDEGLLKGAEMTQRRLHHQSSPEHR